MELQKRDRVAYLTFTRPDHMNSLTEDVFADFETVLLDLEADTVSRALVITGHGKAFCVGLDLTLLRRAFEDLAYFEQVVRRLNKILLRLEALSMPTIAAVNGYARAGGYEVILCCDLVVVAEEAKVGDNHTLYAVAPGGGASQRLPRIIGAQKAKEIIWSARWLTGPELVDYGIALRAVPREQLLDSVEDLLAEIRNKSRDVLAVTKEMIRLGAGLPIEQGIELEIAHFVRYMNTSPDPHEGFVASLEKRKPSWA